MKPTTERVRFNHQIQLLLPTAWVKELDDLARVRNLKRLALIRAYLREQMDNDIERLKSNGKTESYLKKMEFNYAINR